MTVTSVVPDATAQVLAVSEFNDPPPAGYQDFMITVSATYAGTGPSYLDAGTTFRAIGASRIAYTNSGGLNECGDLPAADLVANDPQVFPGGTISGNAACWVVAGGDVSSLVMFAERFASDRDTFFALR